MKVLVVQPTADKMGHYGIYTVKLCQALGKLGHQVTLCTNRVDPEGYVTGPLQFRVHEAYGGRLPFRAYDLARTRQIPYYYYGYFRLSYQIMAAAGELCRTQQFDVAYVTDAEFLMASLALKQYRRVLPPVVMEVSAANFTFSTYPGALPKKVYKVFQREVFKSTLGRELRGIAVLHSWHGERLRGQLALPPEFPIKVIPDGGNEPAAIIERVEARRRLGIDYDGPLLLFFGMLRRDKGLEDLFQAVRRARDTEFRLVVAGHPTEYTPEAVESLVAQAGISDRVILRLGYVPDGDVPAYFGASDALILPYNTSYTGSSGPLAKGACAYGRPAIVSDVAEMGQIARREGFGMVSRPGDPASLAQAITAFLALPPESRQEMGVRAATYGQSNSWDAMAERFTALFEQVVRPASSLP